jgi:sterol 14-demethylase
MASGGIPVFGHALQFLRAPTALIERGYHEHGSIFSLQLGLKRAVILLGPENNRFFFSKTDKLLSIREGYPFFIKMFHERFFFLAEFEEYLKQRAIIIPRFQPQQMHQYVTTMANETFALMERLGEEGTCDLVPTLGPLVMHIAAHTFLGELIEERRRSPVDPPDFLQTLIASHYSDGRPIDDVVIINMILLLVWAGHETTAGHISWGLIDLLQHPAYLQSVRDEQADILGDGRHLSMTEVRQLRRIEWTLKETERLHPVAFVMMRKAAETFTWQGFRIPQDAMVFVAPTLSHRMPEVFPDPDQYRPERFSPEHDESRQPHSLIGFGGGVHRCAGVHFAYLEMKIVLSLLLQQYDFTLLDSEPQPVRGANTKWPASPCRVQYRRRAYIPHKVPRHLPPAGEAHPVGAPAARCPVPH